MAVASEGSRPAGGAKGGSAKDPARSGGALSLGKRFLTLREGSIIVVTIVTFVYFATSTSRFTNSSSLKSLLPYFAPFAIMAAGEVFVMINGEIDLSIGALYLFTPFIFYKLSHNLGLPLIPGLIGAVFEDMRETREERHPDPRAVNCKFSRSLCRGRRVHDVSDRRIDVRHRGGRRADVLRIAS